MAPEREPRDLAQSPDAACDASWASSRGTAQAGFDDEFDDEREEPRLVGLRDVFGGAATFAKLCVAAVLTYTFLFNFSVVRGNSMTPGIHDGDRILIDHVSYWFGDVERGDVVVLKYPLDPSVDYIKRVIGMPGDDVWLKDGEVWVNGRQVDEPYVRDIDSSARLRTRVKPAHYFVLGDNRVRSSDSRDFGLVPQDYVRGKVEVRVWPPARFGRLD